MEYAPLRGVAINREGDFRVEGAPGSASQPQGLLAGNETGKWGVWNLSLQYLRQTVKVLPVYCGRLLR